MTKKEEKTSVAQAIKLIDNLAFQWLIARFFVSMALKRTSTQNDVKEKTA